MGPQKVIKRVGKDQRVKPQEAFLAPGKVPHCMQAVEPPVKIFEEGW